MDEVLEQLDDHSDLDGIAAMCQEELGTPIAYGAVRGFCGGKRRRGPPKEASKGKRKSKFPSKGKSFGKGKAKPSLEERKRRLAEIKRRTRCQECGEIGHWKGDRECRKRANFASLAFAYTGDSEATPNVSSAEVRDDADRTREHRRATPKANHSAKERRNRPLRNGNADLPR